jgi:uncharacterized protein HemX
MDPNNFNSNPNPRPSSNVDGFVSTPTSNSTAAFNRPAEPVPAPPQITPSEVPAPAYQAPAVVTSAVKKGGKKLLFVFIVLFVLATAGAVYMYLQYSSVKKELSDSKSSIQNLNDQISAAKDTTDQAAATAAANLLKETNYATSLSTAAAQLKTKCGTSCNSITIPTVPQ